jgi:alkanesulfonate monooxygenase SsuD/methylene tetrahydromethanopterin reductase-like flavin-dependent oxidoreductase (luciferase family)
LGRQEHEAIGLPYPPIDTRAGILEETCLATRALFAGRAWEGGRHVPAMSGPLLPPAAPPVWVGGRSERVLGIAARAADGWNGWGLSAEAFAARCVSLARMVEVAGRDPAAVPPTWGGIALVGEDEVDLARLESERRANGRSMEIWRGTAADLREFRDALEASGASWLIVSAVGPSDRPALIAETLAS